MNCAQETESSLKQMQQRMQEAEKRMIQDDVTADNMLQIVSSENFPRPRGQQRHAVTACCMQYSVVIWMCVMRVIRTQLRTLERLLGQCLETPFSVIM